MAQLLTESDKKQLNIARHYGYQQLSPSIIKLLETTEDGYPFMLARNPNLFLTLPSNVRTQNNIARLFISSYWNYPNFIPEELFNKIGDAIAKVHDVDFKQVQQFISSQTVWNDIPKNYKQNYGFAYLLVLRNPDYYFQLPEKMRCDESIAFMAVRGNWKVIYGLHKSLKNSLPIALMAVQSTDYPIKVFEVYRDREVTVRMVPHKPEVIHFTPVEVRTDVQQMIALIKETPEIVPLVRSQWYFCTLEMANCLLDIDDKNITYYLDGNNAQFLRENPQILFKAMVNISDNYNASYWLNFAKVNKCQTLEMVLVILINFKIPNGYIIGKELKDLYKSLIGNAICPEFRHHPYLNVAFDIAKDPQLQPLMVELTKELYRREIPLDGNYMNAIRNTSNPMIVTDLSGDSFTIERWFDSDNLLQEVYEQHPTLHGCDLSINIEEQDISIKETPRLFYTNAVYQNEDTPIMVVY